MRWLKKEPTIKAIYGVSFSGNMLNQEKLNYLKKTYNIKIVEDNAHSIGAIYNNIKAGSSTCSDCSIFSFHPVKHITTGEGGAVTTNDKTIYEKLLQLRNHGMVKTPVMDNYYKECFSLPIYPLLSDEEQEYVLKTLFERVIVTTDDEEIAKISREYGAEVPFMRLLHC